LFGGSENLLTLPLFIGVSSAALVMFHERPLQMISSGGLFKISSQQLSGRIEGYKENHQLALQA
jgi:hypothetical protein